MNAPTAALRGSANRRRQRGQVAAIFAGSIVLFIALSAIVVDVANYWVNTLRIQRAADAAALAGAVYLPGDTATAYSIALASAAQNGYVPGPNVAITTIQDASDPRQLDVTIATHVATYFARVVGQTSWPAQRTAFGVYVLPVPMGSPLAYYGVGDFWSYQAGASGGIPTTASPVVWTTPNNGWTTGGSYATSNVNGQTQQYSNFGFGSVANPTDVALSFSAKISGNGSCMVQAQVSWNGGVTWGNMPNPTVNLTTTAASYSLGGPGNSWDSGHTWAAADFANGKFMIRLDYLRNSSSCGTLSVNTIAATVDTSTLALTPTTDGGTTLASQGGWGAIITRGGNQQNGDAYAPANNGGAPFSGANAKYDGRGYNYAVQLPAGGIVKVFDPGFCDMGGNPSGAGNLGAGDHWISGVGAVSTYYTLWNTNGKIGLQGAWTSIYTTVGTYLFQNEDDADKTNGGPTGHQPCDPYHDKWWTVPTGALAGGTYVLQVATSDPNNAGANASVNAENMFAIEAVGGGSPQMYGNGKMAVYNNLQPGLSSQTFYLAKIDRLTGAGKTALIDIFDPGDVPGNAVLKVLSPNGPGGTQVVATFNYTTDGNCNATVNANGWSPSDACAANGVSQITTAVNGRSSFNNTWIHIQVPLPPTYGAGGLWAPPSNPSDQGWWQIQYATPGGGNDTTTWQVSVSGNPVHLLVP